MNGMFDQISSYERSTTARRPVRLSWWTMLVVSPMIIGIVFGIYMARGNWAIAKRQQTAYGTISAHQPSNHDRYQYTFLADGRPYTGSETRAKNELELGQRVLVYYDPANPAQNALTDFAVFGDRNLIPIPLFLISAAVMAMVIALTRRFRPAS